MQGTIITAKKENRNGRFAKAKKLITGVCGAGYMAFSSMPVTVLVAAAGPASITQPLDNLKTIVISVIGAVGVIILAKNVMDVCNPYVRMDLRTSSRTRQP